MSDRNLNLAIAARRGVERGLKARLVAEEVSRRGDGATAHRISEENHVVACSACREFAHPPRLATTTYQSCHEYLCVDCARAHRQPKCGCEDA